MAPLDPPLRHGIREASGRTRPSPGILCWNCRELTPFPADTCKWCGAAFAGSHGGAYADHVPEITVRARVSTPAGPSRGPTPEMRRLVAQIAGGGSFAGSHGPQRGADTRGAGERQRRRLAVSLPAGVCPVCGRPSPPSARRCACGAVFGDAATTFNCGECGSVLPVDADHCFVCGTTFPAGRGATYACPVCGSVVAPSATACRCGAQFVD